MERNTIPLIGGLHIGAPEPIDDRLLGDSITEYLVRVPKQLRYIGLPVTLVINGISTKYWFKQGIEDGDLVLDVTDVGNPAFTPKTLTSLDDTILITEFDQTTDLSATPRYTSLIPTPEQVHGIPKDAVFDKVLMAKVIDDLLHPYLAPTLYNFYIDGVPRLIEVGIDVSGTKTFMWSKTNYGNIKVNSGTIQNLTDASIIKTGINITSLSRTSEFVIIDNTAPFIKSFNLIGLDIHEQVITSNTFTMESVFPMFVGSVTNLNPTEQDISLMERVVQTKGAITRSNTVTWKRLCFAYPANYGSLISIKDTSGFENIGGFTKTDLYISINGISCLYNVYTLTKPTTIVNFNMSYIF